MHFPDVCAGSGPPVRTGIVHRRTNELFIRQNAVYDRPLFILRRGPSMPILWAVFFPTRFMTVDYVRCVLGGHPEIPSCVDTLDWHPKEVFWPGLLGASRVLFETLMVDGDPQSRNHCSVLLR